MGKADKIGKAGQIGCLGKVGKMGKVGKLWIYFPHIRGYPEISGEGPGIRPPGLALLMSGRAATSEGAGRSAARRPDSSARR